MYRGHPAAFCDDGARGYGNSGTLSFRIIPHGDFRAGVVPFARGDHHPHRYQAGNRPSDVVLLPKRDARNLAFRDEPK
ncbi:hypothetical protein [Arthrobacter sp. MA-N2]|uniref:hypothetical protein n=1 Tax=Arthrobacter sp. MA-N2 TaxID=1101188 RepID=UPI0004BA9471|nr:hypothetical protein [Arthrobacter sp. MA-N2]